MTTDEYITYLRSINIVVTLQEDKIAVEDPNDALTPEILEELKKRKSDIIEFFNLIKSKKELFVDIPKAPVNIYYPLSSAQKRMYFLYEFDKESTAYNMPVFFRLGKPLDIDRLELTFKKLVSRHQSFRTVFEIVDGLPVQRILNEDSFEIGLYKGDVLEMNAYIESFIRPFQLSSEFPIRISLMEVTDEDYLLMLDMHHIISDGVSHEILMREFWILYKGEELDALGIQYTDYAVWQQGEAHQELVSTHKSYWQEVYLEEIPVLELPLDYPRPLYKGGAGDSHTLELNKEQSEKLRGLASFSGVTVYTLLLAVYNILLSKLGNQEDIIVGTPTAGRHHADLEAIVGMFVNTLALRNRVDSGAQFKDFLASVHECTLSAFDHQLYQYEELVDSLDLPRDANRNPLFDISFTYAKQVEDINFNDPELKISYHEIKYNIAKFDLTLSVLDAEEISLVFKYRTDLFTPSSVARFSGYLNQIIEAVLENPMQRIQDIEIISKEEKTQLLVEFNDTFVDYDLQQTVLDQFIAQASKTPDAEAIVFGEERLTYRELDIRSNLWASHLMDLGVFPSAIVGLIMTRSIEMITAIVSVMKCGAAYLPINPTQPISRTQHVVEQCGCEFLISNLEEQPEIVQGCAFLSPAQLDAQKDVQDILPKVSPDSLAYVIYTSGSTGDPKGVMVNHESVTNLIHHERDFLGIDAHDRILQFSPYYFDVSVQQIWLSLTTGAVLVLIDAVVLTDQELFVGYLDRHLVTHLNVTPSFLESLSLPVLQNIKRIVVSGEECKAALARKYNKDYDFYNEYGPTETTVISISQKLTSETLKKDKVSIGRPIANTQGYILDAKMNLLPLGVKGELYIGGKGLSLGYLNRLDLTQERFIANPFGFGLLYKTGDLAKWLPDGTIDYLGRSDGQIKLNGVRIELGEIESCLNVFEGIKDSVVSLRKIQNNKCLVAYYVCEDIIPSYELKNYLIDILPFNMIPSYYLQLAKLPLSPTGKLDRRLLPDPEKEERVYVPPSNEIEKQLVQIWSELLEIEIEKINVDDGFFELGGNSLKAISLMNTIYKTVSVKITLKEIFIKQTIREIADYIITVKQIKETNTDNKEEVKLIL